MNDRTYISDIVYFPDGKTFEATGQFEDGTCGHIFVPCGKKRGTERLLRLWIIGHANEKTDYWIKSGHSTQEVDQGEFLKIVRESYWEGDE